MWEGNYGKEPFDLRLTVLRLIANLHVVLVFTIAGTLLFGGGYYVKNILLNDQKQYSVTYIYRVEYVVEEEKDVGTVHINEMSWNTYLHSQEFLDAVMARLEEPISKEEVSESLTAYLASDLHVPSTTVITDSEEKSLIIAEAVGQAMTKDFPEGIREISNIRVIDSPQTASEVILDVRPVRAFVLSGTLSCFFAVVILLLKETGDDNIWLPATIGKRYGLKVVGTIESSQLSENLHYFYEGKKKVAVCTVQSQIDPGEILTTLREKSAEDMTEWFVAPSPVLCPESCRALREAEGILLAVQAGAHAGKQLEHCLEYLRQQDCDVTSVILWNADEKLIKAYYYGLNRYYFGKSVKCEKE